MTAPRPMSAGPCDGLFVGVSVGVVARRDNMITWQSGGGVLQKLIRPHSIYASNPPHKESSMTLSRALRSALTK